MTAKQRVPRGQWPPAEKRRIVELTLRAGALKAILPANR
jgi:transposase-like protein